MNLLINFAFCKTQFVLKKRRVLTFLAYIMTANLLFTQVIAGFLHEHEHQHHHEHPSSVEETTRYTTFLDTEEHKCEICALQLFHDLYFEALRQFVSAVQIQNSVLRYFNSFKIVYSIFSKGRAPPFSLI